MKHVLLMLLFSLSTGMSYAETLSAADRALRETSERDLDVPVVSNPDYLGVSGTVRLGNSGVPQVFANPSTVDFSNLRARDWTRLQIPANGLVPSSGDGQIIVNIRPRPSVESIPVDGSDATFAYGGYRNRGLGIFRDGGFQNISDGYGTIDSLINVNPSLGGRYDYDEEGNLRWCPISGDPAVGIDRSGLTSLRGNCFDSYPAGFNTGLRNIPRDLGLCSCLERTRGTTLETIPYEPSEDFESNRRAAMAGNLRQVNDLIQVEQNSMSFQASALPSADSTKTSDDFITAYTRPPQAPQSFNFIQREVSRLMGTDAPVSLTFPRTNRSNFAADDDLTGNNCIPYRAYLYQQMLPSNPTFIADLQAQGNEYRNEDWDISLLRAKFIQVTRALPSFADAMNNEEASKIFRRMEFLQRNPMIKNLFSARADLPRSAELKDKFFKLMKRNLSPNSYNTPAERFAAFQGSMRMFFSGTVDANQTDSGQSNFLAIRDMVQDGASTNVRRAVLLAPKRVQIITNKSSPEDLWSASSLSLNDFPTGNGADLLVALSARSSAADRDPANYARYCPRLRYSVQMNQWNVLSELDDRMSEIYPGTPTNDRNYRNSNDNVCNSSRKAPDGTKKTFSEFLDTACPNHTGMTCAGNDQGWLVAQYLKAYPTLDPATEEDTANVTALLPFINGDIKRSSTRPTDADQYARGAGVPTTRVQANNIVQLGQQTSDLPPSVRSSLNEQMGRTESALKANVDIAKNTNSSPTNNAAAATSTNQAPNAATGPAGFVPVVIPDQVVAPQTADAEKIRSKVRESDSEISKISDQISTLRDDMGRSQAAGNDQSSPQYRDLMERMNSLESSIQRERDQNTALRRQLAQAEGRVPRPSDAPGVADSSPTPSTQSRAPASTQDSQASSGVTSGAQTGSPQTTGQAQLGSGNVPTAAFSPVASFAQATRISGGQLNTALLSKYNVQSITSQGGIIVADPNPSIDLQQLRSDSSDNVVRLTFSDADVTNFSQDEGRALAAYMDRVQGSPGEVVRVLITLPGSSEPVERFVLKSQGRLSIVPPPAPVARAPASGARYRLSDLVNELQSNR